MGAAEAPVEAGEKPMAQGILPGEAHVLLGSPGRWDPDAEDAPRAGRAGVFWVETVWENGLKPY